MINVTFSNGTIAGHSLFMNALDVSSTTKENAQKLRRARYTIMLQSKAQCAIFIQDVKNSLIIEN